MCWPDPVLRVVVEGPKLQDLSAVAPAPRHGVGEGALHEGATLEPSDFPPPEHGLRPLDQPTGVDIGVNRSGLRPFEPARPP